MKINTNNLIPIVLIIGVIVLFFFPSPQSNFIAYITTALIFIVLIVFLLVKSKSKKFKK